MLGRETDPITHADVARTRYYALGRGVTIALYSALPARRSAFGSALASADDAIMRKPLRYAA